MRVYNPWVFANYGQPQRQRGYISPVVYQSTYPRPIVRMPRVRRWRGDPWFSQRRALGLTVEEMHSETKRLMIIGLVLTGIGVFAALKR